MPSDDYEVNQETGFIIWNPDSDRPPTKVFEDYESAEKAAKRLAKTAPPGETFNVCLIQTAVKKTSTAPDEVVEKPGWPALHFKAWRNGGCVLCGSSTRGGGYEFAHSKCWSKALDEYGHFRLLDATNFLDGLL